MLQLYSEFTTACSSPSRLVESKQNKYMFLTICSNFLWSLLRQDEVWFVCVLSEPCLKYSKVQFLLLAEGGVYF